MTRLSRLISLSVFCVPAALFPGNTAHAGAVTCFKEFKPEYAAHYGIDEGAWKSQCSGGIEPADILGMAAYDCSSRYEPKRMDSFGVGIEQWNAFCEDRASAVSKEDFLARQLRSFVLDRPGAELSMEAASLFMESTADDDSAQVQAKRKELAPMLKRLRGAERRLGRSLARLPMATPGGGIEEALLKLSESFDGAAPPGDGGRAPDAVGARPAGPARRSGLAPAAKRAPADLEAEDALRLLSKLRADIDILQALRLPANQPLHDPQTISSLRLIADYIASNPRPDFSALSDAGRVIEALSRHGVVVEWKIQAARDENYIHDPLRKTYIRRADMSGKPYSPEQLAGLLLHGAGGHGHAFSEGGGMNMMANELDAWFMQHRFYSNVRRSLDAKVRELRKAVEKGRLPAAELAARKKELAETIDKRDHFLEPAYAADLRRFERDSAAFIRTVLRPYYGEEIFPGAVTPRQQRELLRKQLVLLSDN